MRLRISSDRRHLIVLASGTKLYLANLEPSQVPGYSHSAVCTAPVSRLLPCLTSPHLHPFPLICHRRSQLCFFPHFSVSPIPPPCCDIIPISLLVLAAFYCLVLYEYVRTATQIHVTYVPGLNWARVDINFSAAPARL